MKRTLLLIILFSFIGLNAQDYKQAIGLRGGLHSGVTYKNFITNTTAIEGIIHSRWRGLELVGLLEHHNEISSVDGLFWYYGYGAHVGFYDAKYTHWSESGSYTVIGIDGILALEYKIRSAPISIGVDWKPYFNIIGYSGFFGDGGALFIRYTF